MSLVAWSWTCSWAYWSNFFPLILYMYYMCYYCMLKLFLNCLFCLISTRIYSRIEQEGKILTCRLQSDWKTLVAVRVLGKGKNNWVLSSLLFMQLLHWVHLYFFTTILWSALLPNITWSRFPETSSCILIFVL